MAWQHIAQKAAGCFRRLWGDKQGQIIAIAAVGMPVMCGLTGVATDTVSWFLWRRQLQTGVDAAALAGAHAVLRGGRSDAVRAAVIEDLRRNEIFDEATVHMPAQNGPLAGQSGTVEVIVRHRESLPFSSLFMTGPATVSARAVGRVASAGQNCVISLNPTASGALTFQGSANVNLGCGIVANSQNQSALLVGGSSMVTATPVSAVGGISVGASAQVITSGPLQPMSPPQPDPFANTTPPDWQSMKCENPSNKATVFSPGRYCGGISISGGVVTFEPGVYVLDGGTFKVTGNAKLEGNGVTFFLTGRNNNYAGLDLSGGTEIKLRAPSAGSPYAGLLFYQDPNAPPDTNERNKINGNAELELQGAIYFPRQQLEFSGAAANNTSCLLIVADRVVFTGNAEIDNDCAPNSGVNPSNNYHVVLAE